MEKPQLEARMKGSVGEIDVYGVIGSDYNGITSGDFVQAMNTIKASELVMHINSVGGSVSEGTAMFHRARQFSGKLTTIVEGAAWSAASVLMLSGDDRVMLHGARIMVHEAEMPHGGRASELTKSAQLIADINQKAAEVYADRSQWSVEQALSMMEEETWLNTDEAFKAGFTTIATDGTNSAPPKMQVSAEMLGRLRHPPTDIAVEAELAKRQSDDVMRRYRAVKAGKSATPELSRLIQDAFNSGNKEQLLDRISDEASSVTAEDIDGLLRGKTATLPIHKLTALGRIAGLPTSVELRAASEEAGVTEGASS